jgi:flavin-binding protein dodecin
MLSPASAESRGSRRTAQRVSNGTEVDSSGSTREDTMPDKVYKMIEIVGTSTQGIEAAVQNAIAQARKTVKGLSWFEVSDMRGNLQGKEIRYQVALKVGFELMED